MKKISLVIVMTISSSIQTMDVLPKKDKKPQVKNHPTHIGTVLYGRKSLHESPKSEVIALCQLFSPENNNKSK